MAVGGNQRARTFFKQHGWDEVRLLSAAAVCCALAWALEPCTAAAAALGARLAKLCGGHAPTSQPGRACCCANGMGALPCLLPQVGSDKIEAKYTSRAAQLYRKQLEKDAGKLAGVSSCLPRRGRAWMHPPLPPLYAMAAVAAAAAAVLLPAV